MKCIPLALVASTLMPCACSQKDDTSTASNTGAARAGSSGIEVASAGNPGALGGSGGNANIPRSAGASTSLLGGTDMGGQNSTTARAGNFSSAGTASESNSRAFIVGLGPTWKWYFGQAEDQSVPTPSIATIQDMMLDLSTSAQMVLAQSGWRANVLGQVPGYFNDLVNVWPNPPVLESPRKFEFVSYGINFFDQGTGVAQLSTPNAPDNAWMSNHDAATEYTRVALGLCSAPYNARYIALGLEVNSYADRTSLDDYVYFVENVYIPIYDAIKAIDPTIGVFVTFQLEQMKGLGSEWGFVPKAHWDRLALYRGKLDFLAFTTYPEFVYGDPASIPEDYYSSIATSVPESLKTKPFAFVELGWSDRDGSAASQRAQAEFLSRFLTLTRGLDVEYINWVFLHDEHRQPFNPKLRLGLKDYDGNARPVWNAWRSLLERPYVPRQP